MPDTPIIDPEAIRNLKELNPDDNGEFLKDIIQIYVDDTPNRIADLKKSLAANDTPSFTRAAHTIKGSSSNVGAMTLRGVAERMELLSRKEGIAAAGALIGDCESEFAKAAAELKKLTG